MLKQKSYEPATTGKLYLVPTPIGNLEDMSVRCVKVLKAATIIASEDTRNTQKLLNHFDVHVPQISLHEHNYEERIPQLMQRLQAGETIAQVSDAGMPSISDPGHELVLACLAQGIHVIALPGPSAGITALIASGLLLQPFTFYGFLPRKKKEQKARMEVLKERTSTQIFYESPYRIGKTVALFAAVYGPERQAVICRELTKIHEEYLRGTLGELSDYLAEHTLKGECCLLIAGFSGEPSQPVVLPVQSLKEQVQLLVDQGKPAKEAIKEVAKRSGHKKQTVYREYHLE